ncbi:MAG: hypothetical protein GY745_20460 [Actinomycetia bacterium]|nr:hypothetical protein [Actinomycetes bacterium]
MVLIDAIMVKTRGGQVAIRPVYAAIGVTVDGKRGILGLWVGTGGEDAKHWLAVLTGIKNRGPTMELVGFDRRDIGVGADEGVVTPIGPQLGLGLVGQPVRRTTRRACSMVRFFSPTVGTRGGGGADTAIRPCCDRFASRETGANQSSAGSIDGIRWVSGAIRSGCWKSESNCAPSSVRRPSLRITVSRPRCLW